MWTDERVSTLRQLWAEGISASEIAAQLGGFEHTHDGGKSAVCGKAYRLRRQGYHVPAVSKAEAARRGGAAGKGKPRQPRFRPPKLPAPPRIKPKDPHALIVERLLAEAHKAERRRDQFRTGRSL